MCRTSSKFDIGICLIFYFFNLFHLKLRCFSLNYEILYFLNTFYLCRTASKQKPKESASYRAMVEVTVVEIHRDFSFFRKSRLANQ